MAHTKTEEYNKWLNKDGNREKVKARMKLYRQKNREKLRLSKIEYRSNPENREKLYIAAKKWLEEHPDAKASYTEKEKQKVKTGYQRLMMLRNKNKYSRDHSRIAARNEKARLRVAKNPQINKSNKLRCNLYKCLTRERTTDRFCLKHIGCTKQQLRCHLQSKFTEGMTFENYGQYWELDHIKPLSLFDLTNDDQYMLASHYTNIQPLWRLDNLLKSNKYIESIKQ